MPLNTSLLPSIGSFSIVSITTMEISIFLLIPFIVSVFAPKTAPSPNCMKKYSEPLSANTEEKQDKPGFLSISHIKEKLSSKRQKVQEKSPVPTNIKWLQTTFEDCSDGKNEQWSHVYENIAVYAMVGKRDGMEDRFSIVVNKENGGDNFVGFAVYDGHGGKGTADFLEKSLLPSILRNFRSSVLALSGAFDGESPPIHIGQIIEEEILKHDKEAVKLPEVGSTALVGVLHKKLLYIANVGDCRAVVFNANKGEIWQTTDHKPKQEKERIEMAGGLIMKVNPFGPDYVMGQLGVGRAIGDGYLKEYVTATPDVSVINLDQFKYQFMVMASDGLWDMFTSRQAVDFISQRLNQKDFGAKELAEMAKEKGSKDNISVMIIKF